MSCTYAPHVPFLEIMGRPRGKPVDRRRALRQAPDVKTVLYDTVGSFADVAAPLLHADPLRHTVAITVLDGLRRGGRGAAALLTLHEDGEVVGAVLRTPGRSALVSGVPPQYAAVAEEALAAADPDLGGADGPVPEVEAFVAARVARTGERTETRMRVR